MLYRNDIGIIIFSLVFERYNGFFESIILEMVKLNSGGIILSVLVFCFIVIGSKLNME